ncbi:MAG: FAD-dependent oxidoreductase, partial [Methanomicrobiales archaeon]|nr:FAD-dependent oxidoreductase [Methanomicrobiales archaeon]
MIVVIGAGPAGRFGAMRLARAGREVTLVDRAGVGGQCLNHGCMVVCALSDVARTVRYARTMADL